VSLINRIHEYDSFTADDQSGAKLVVYTWHSWRALREGTRTDLAVNDAFSRNV
jgi:hypothetical protein